jgi:hypothetical protein
MWNYSFVVRSPFFSLSLGNVPRIRDLLKLGRLLMRDEDCPPQQSLRQFALDYIAPALPRVSDVYELAHVWPSTLFDLRKEFMAIFHNQQESLASAVKVRLASFFNVWCFTL